LKAYADDIKVSDEQWLKANELNKRDLI
jgi:hypothetical protein